MFMAGTLQSTIILNILNMLHLIPMPSVDASTTYSPQGKEFINTTFPNMQLKVPSCQHLQC